MARFAQRDQTEMRQLAAAFPASHTDELTTLFDRLRGLLRAEHLVAYSPRRRPTAYALDFAFATGFASEERLRARLDATLARANRPWALFNPLAPETSQRNRALNLPSPSHWRSTAGRATLARLGYGAGARAALCRRMERLNQGPLRELELADQHVCRILVCDGPRLIAFVGAFRAEAFGERERQLLGALAEPLRVALKAVQSRAHAVANAAAIDGLLESLGRPAFIVDADGAVAHANEAGCAELARDGELLDALRAVAHGDPRSRRRLSATPLGSGPDAQLLVAIEPDLPSVVAGLQHCAERWRLTAREAEVLAGVARGASTKQLAAQLRSSTRAVEHHLTQLFRKAHVDGRGSLVARLLALCSRAASS